MVAGGSIDTGSTHMCCGAVRAAVALGQAARADLDQRLAPILFR
jgi:hypothetical protein